MTPKKNCVRKTLEDAELDGAGGICRRVPRYDGNGTRRTEAEGRAEEVSTGGPNWKTTISM